MRILLFLIFAYQPICEDVQKDIKKAQDQVRELQGLMRGQQPKELQWNRYVTKNFEILSLDDAQGKYLSDSIEHIKVWTLWRWGISDVDFQMKCKLICVPSVDLYEKLFNKKTSSWRAEIKNGNLETTVWIISSGEKWNTHIPTQLTECVLSNFELIHGRKIPIWAHRGISLLNGRFSDIRSQFPLVTKFDVKMLLETTPDIYNKFSEGQKSAFDAQATVFCLWVRQEFDGKVFLDFLGSSIVNPEWSLQYFGLTTYVSCNEKLQIYLPKLANATDSYLTW
jgi:hypothetical protein